MFNLFKKSNKSHRLQIIISVDYKDNIDIKYDYNPEDKDKSYKMGVLLYCLSNKLLTKNLVEALIDNNAVFATEVVNNWSSFDSINQQNNSDPIIQPLNAFSKNVK